VDPARHGRRGRPVRRLSDRVRERSGERSIPRLEALHTGLAWAVAWFAGERARLRREHIAELEQRALRAEREAAREGRLAVVEERTRIARDLHDSAAMRST